MPDVTILDNLIIEKDQITKAREGYDPKKGEELANWVFQRLEEFAQNRRKTTREDEWDAEWKFIAGNQWEGPLPSYRRPIVVNVWRRVEHRVMATLVGQRPLVKIVPQGKADPKWVETWQHALWAILKKEEVFEKYEQALLWGHVGDGGWFKVGYGRRGGPMDEEPNDVLVTSPHPAKVYPSPECTDESLVECPIILYRETLDLATITSRYPEQGWRVEADDEVSMKWTKEPAPWAAGGPTISPAGGWSANKEYARARATIVECWIDDSSQEQYEVTVPDGSDPVTGEVIFKKEKRWRKMYPYGRLITCSRTVTLRDIPNPYGRSMGWRNRWPFVLVSQALHPHTTWRPGLLSNQRELNRSINKMMSLLMENAIKCTNAMVIADENAMDDEDWDLLTLIPGVKIRKRPGTEFKIEFPQALPAHAFQLPDYLIRKVEEQVGLQDPPIAPGQAVAAKTVQFLQSKGSFLLGLMAMLGDRALERMGNRVLGLMFDRYLPGRLIPYFPGEQIPRQEGSGELPVGSQEHLKWPDMEMQGAKIPPSMRARVEASSGFAEVMMSGMAMAQAEAAQRKRTR